MKRMMFLTTLLFLALHFGCTPMPPMQEGQTVDLAEAERDFDPLAQDRERPIVIGEQEGESGRSEISQEDSQDPGFQEKLSDPGRPGVAQGYRVQIFLCDDLREASRMLAEARSKFEEQVYLEYDAPYYKVRVGDCQTEPDGEKLLKIARRFGYQEAWLVYTVISVPEEPDRR